MIGKVLEQDDFAIYCYFTASIGRNYFPSEGSAALRRLAHQGNIPNEAELKKSSLLRLLVR